MIRTIRILTAGLLHVLASKIDAHDTVMVDMTTGELDAYYDAMHARLAEIDRIARSN